MIQIKDLTKSFGARTLFSGVNLVVNPRERVGLVGRNGTGKSTLLKLILGEENCDDGEVAIPKNYRIGALRQKLDFKEKTILEEAALGLQGDRESQLYKAEKILFGLGFSDEDLSKGPASFSGGYQIRVNVAKLLVSGPDMLLLDEPTNYLDIVSLIWLRRFLRSFPGEVLIITHDREFMDSVCTHTMGISRGKIKKVKGNTAKFYEQILLEEEIHEQTRLNQEKRKKELQNFVDRFRAKASKASQAQSKLKQLEKMKTLDKLQEEGNLGFRFHYKECPGKFPLEVENLAFGYREDALLFKNLSFALERHDRLGIIGKNGKGKSTLLNVLIGDLKPVEGSFKYHSLALVGHFGQTNIERLHPRNSIVQEIAEANPELSRTEIRSIAGSMMFQGDDADKAISVLSGGEKSRVLLGKVLAHSANILLLDEPTNHLDMESIEILCQEIDRFPGAVVIVTHSEMLLRRLANRLIVFRPRITGGAEFFHGGYDDFLSKIGWREGEEVFVKKSLKLTHREIKQQRSQLTLSRSKELRPWREKLELVEGEIAKLEELLEKYNALLGEKSRKNEDVLEVTQMIGQIHIKIEEKFEAMEKASRCIEQIEKVYQAKVESLD